MPLGLAALPEQKVSEAFRAAPGIVSENGADSGLQKTRPLHALHVIASAPGTLDLMSRDGLLFRDRFNNFFCILDRQSPLLDVQSKFRNMVGAQLNIEFRLMAFSTGFEVQVN